MDAEALLERLDGVERKHGYAIARCPAHEDNHASMTIGPGTSQPVVIKCHAGCEPEDILAKVGLTWDDICAPREDKSSFIAEYEYRDEDRRVLFQVCRTADKRFLQRVPDLAGGWRWGLGKTRRVLYRLPEIIAAVSAHEVIYVCEGEKDANALVAHGVQATCNPGGTGGGWRDEYSAVLRDATVIIIADKDESGRKHARRVALSLKGIAAAVEIVEAAEGKDAADHFSRGHTVAEFSFVVDDVQPRMAPTLRTFLDVVERPQDWVIPDMIERGDRLIWTGYEGLGKSWIVRQLAVAAAAGIHPFTGQRFPPRRVLYVDCENPERLSRRSFRRMTRVAVTLGTRAVDMLCVEHIPAGLDLSDPEDVSYLCDLVAAHEPDLLTIGPFYRLHSSDTNDEKAARQVVAALDAARLRSGCALLVEHHPGHGDPGNRSLRPTGSSLLMRWPEMGYGIKPCGEPDDGGHFHEVRLLSWRPPRDERHWPRKLIWGGDQDWPWVQPPEEINGYRVPALMGRPSTDLIGGND